MAVDVSSLVRMMNGGDMTEESTAPITRDLLGGCCAVDAQELDLDLQAPAGWEKRLDLKTGKIYFERCNSANFPKQGQTLNLLEDFSLDLKLTSPSSFSSYQSVCTLDKVKSALERAAVAGKRSVSSSSTSSSSVKDSDLGGVDREDRSSGPAFAAAGCPGCLMYVLVSPDNPTCPRCGCSVPVVVAGAKRQRIDLNLSV